MNESRVKEIDYIIAWLLMFFATTVGYAFAGALGGYVAGVMLSGSATSLEGMRITVRIVGFVLALPISYICFRLIVAKVIVRRFEAPPPPPES